MSAEDEKTYIEARPYIRGVIALLFALRFGTPPPGATFEYYFVMADSFLTTFEQRRS